MAEKASVLVVDDERHLRNLLEILLTHEGYAVKTATGGESALAMLRAERFDLVLSDLRMEPMDGFTLLENVLELQDPPPLVVMTAARSTDVVEELQQKGAAGYVVKPFNLKELVKTVAQVIASE